LITIGTLIETIYLLAWIGRIYVGIILGIGTTQNYAFMGSFLFTRTLAFKGILAVNERIPIFMNLNSALRYLAYGHNIVHIGILLSSLIP